MLCLKKSEVTAMSSKEILEQALKLRPDEKFSVVEGLLRSLDEPNATLEAIWAEEAEKRLKAYREGRLEGIPMEKVFKE
jgi:putative addiction module component (TIGR02574 family)